MLAIYFTWRYRLKPRASRGRCHSPATPSASSGRSRSWPTRPSRRVCPPYSLFQPPITDHRSSHANRRRHLRLHHQRPRFARVPPILGNETTFAPGERANMSDAAEAYHTLPGFFTMRGRGRKRKRKTSGEKRERLLPASRNCAKMRYSTVRSTDAPARARTCVCVHGSRTHRMPNTPGRDEGEGGGSVVILRSTSAARRPSQPINKSGDPRLFCRVSRASQPEFAQRTHLPRPSG